MKLSDMILHATAQDTASGDVDHILSLAHAQAIESNHKRGHLRIAAVIAAALCLLTVTLYATGALSGFAAGFTAPISSGGVQVLAQASDNPNVTWAITESWYDSYNLHIGGTVTTPDILDPEKSYKATALFHGANDGETYYLDGTLYPNGTDTVPFVMSAPTVTDSESGKFRPGWDKEKIKVKLTIEQIYLEPKTITGQWNITDYLVYPGNWNYTLSLTQQEHRDTLTLTGPFSGATAEAVTANQVKLSPFTLEIDGEHLMRSNHTRYNIWLKMKDGTYALKERGMFRDASGNYIAFDDSADDRIAVSFVQPIDVSQVEAIILADAHGFGGAELADAAEFGFISYPVANPAALNVITDTEGEVWEMWKVLLEIPLK